MIEIFKDFHFDAAHHMAMNVPEGHVYSRMHGHSFAVTVTLRGEPDPVTGWLVDFAAIDQAITKVHGTIDHHCLNAIPGLEMPTLENIARWIWNRLLADLPLLYSVAVRRGTLGEGCIYRG